MGNIPEWRLIKLSLFKYLALKVRHSASYGTLIRVTKLNLRIEESSSLSCEEIWDILAAEIRMDEIDIAQKRKMVDYVHRMQEMVHWEARGRDDIYRLAIMTEHQIATISQLIFMQCKCCFQG